MRRVFLFVLDSLGVGAQPDANSFGDLGAHTLDHIIEAAGGLDVPRLVALGLGCIPGVHGLPRPAQPAGAFGRMREISPGKDTPTGHWEMMGCALESAFPVYEQGFAPEIIAAFIERAGLPGILCNAAASGTEVIERLGPEHIATGKPIVYTSADSVFQVAAHEEHFGLERLLEICLVARELLDPMQIGRVIARPFVGEPGSFKRTYNRRDYALEPPRDTALDRLSAAGVPVIAVGKISDIFSGRGISRSVHTEGNDDGMRVMIELAREVQGGLVFINLVDFDSLYGHRRDPLGYRRALEDFDKDYQRFESELRPDDLVFMTADHGTDPTFPGHTDHTREYVPILACGAGVRGGVELGTRAGFIDLGATVEEALGLAAPAVGRSFLAEISV